MRRRIDLDGTWEFMHAGTHSFQPVKVRNVRVPSPWQAEFPDLRTKAGIGIYRRTFVLPEGWREGRVLLHFGAVFHTTRVWVNGVAVGSNEGGFLPFEFDISETAVEGENEIKVRVESPTDNPLIYPDTPLGEIPFGKQSWYGPLSGIWQSVWVECRQLDYIGDLRIRAHLDTGKVDICVLWNDSLRLGAEIVVDIVDPGGTVVTSAIAEVAAGAEEFAITLDVPEVQAWSPDEPHIYRAIVRLVRREHPIDEIARTFGFRTFEARDGRFFLNGEQIYIRGALDQDYYPDTICTLPSVEFVEDQIHKAKELGLNCIRLHIKAADPRYLDAADRLGILIWAELPNGGVSTERSRARKERLLKGMVDRDGHHPSIVIWTIINENWGVDLVHDPSHRDWLRRRYEWLKHYDTARLVVDNSPLHPSFHVETDIVDYHFYAAIPDNRHAWDKFVDMLADRKPFLFSPEDAVTTGKEPLMCSEFGNWGLPNPRELADAEGREPWWFETGHDWGGGVMYPHGMENRFADWHLDRVFGTLDDFVVAAQWQQFRALKYQIEKLRAREEIAGYVITELTDVHWESNGLLDMRRNKRVFHDVFETINSDTMIVPEIDRTSFWAGERARVRLKLAHGGGKVLESSALAYQVSGCDAEPGSVQTPPLHAGSVVDIGEIELALPEVTTGASVRVDFFLGDSGRPATRAWIDLALHPKQRDIQRVPVYSPDATIREFLSRLGYEVVQESAAAFLIVSTALDDAEAAHVRQGGRLLLLPEADMPLYPLFPHWQNVQVEGRAGTPWQGDWASSFSWLHRVGPFAAIPGGPLLDMAFDRVLPTHVISGANLHDFHGRVHAGLVVGWIHKPVALAIERGYGNGHFVASTFRLFRDAPGADPTATLLLDALVERAVLGRELPMEPQDVQPVDLDFTQDRAAG